MQPPAAFNPEAPQPQPPLPNLPPSSSVWNGWMSLLWWVVIFFGFITIQSLIFVFGAISILNEKHPEGYNVLQMANNPDSELYQLQTNGDLIGWVSIGSGILCTFLILLFIRLKKGEPWRTYLNLNKVKPLHWILWIGGTVAFGALMELVTASSDAFETSFMSDVYSTSTMLPLLYLGVGIIGPIFEEVWFRGFFFKGLSHSWGPHAAVLITSLIFTFIHMQYSLEVLLLLFPMGLLLGYARHYTGSLWVPIVIHILNNCLTIFLTGLSM